QIFGQLGQTTDGKTCKGMKGLIAEGDEAIEEHENSVRDAALIGAAQRVEHYEMAGYGTALSFAKLLGHQDAIELLQDTLNEEKAADEKLTEIAESEVNEQALAGAERE